MPLSTILPMFLCALFCTSEAVLTLHRAQPAQIEVKNAQEQYYSNVVVPADTPTMQLPGLKTLEMLRSAPIHDLEACAKKGFCSATLSKHLHDFYQHQGAVELLDSMVANFCLKSPLLGKVGFCKSHNFDGIVPDLHDHGSTEYKNIEVLNCVLDLPECSAEVRTHLDALLYDDVTIRSLAEVVRYGCRTNKQPFTSQLLSCQAGGDRYAKRS